MEPCSRGPAAGGIGQANAKNKVRFSWRLGAPHMTSRKNLNSRKAGFPAMTEASRDTQARKKGGGKRKERERERERETKGTGGGGGGLWLTPMGQKHLWSTWALPKWLAAHVRCGHVLACPGAAYSVATVRRILANNFGTSLLRPLSTLLGYTLGWHEARHTRYCVLN